MSVNVIDAARVDRVMSLAGALAAHGLAAVPPPPDDVNPGHPLASSTAGGRLGWALAVARVASMAAAAMTYGDDFVLDGRPSWDPDLFDGADPFNGGDPDLFDLGDAAVELHSLVGNVVYNTVSNGGADFLPAAAAAILAGLRDSLPVRRNGLYGMIPDVERMAARGAA